MTILTDAQLAQLLVLSYAAPPDVKASDDARAGLHWFPDELCVVVPGTVTVPGWIRDFEFLPHDDIILGRCHSGFLRNGQALWLLVKPAVLSAAKTGKTITFAGHSLGGAEAQICAALAVAYGVANVRVMTCGSPRIALWANRKFRKLLVNVPANLWKRAGDPVPHVPPIWWFGHVRVNTILGSTLTPKSADFPLDPVNDKNHGIALYAKDLSERAP